MIAPGLATLPHYAYGSPREITHDLNKHSIVVAYA